MDNKYLLSDNPEVLAKALTKAIEKDISSPAKIRALEGKRYYRYEHDILQNRIFYVDDNDEIREDRNASNIKIPHAFFTELVDQKVQYLLSKGVKVKVEDEKLQTEIDRYYDEHMDLFLQEVVEGFSKKGHEYVFARTTSDDRLTFQISDSMNTFSVYDDNGNTVRIVRNYTKPEYNNGRIKSIMYAEVWDDKQVIYFKTNKFDRLELDTSKELNPKPHIVARKDDKIFQRGYGRIPFYRVSNNKYETTDLQPIKALIDDYDLMACFLSNNLQDFSEAIYVVKGFRGDDLSKLRQNLKAKKTIGVGKDGGVDVKTVEIPVKARQVKLDIDERSIYRFGMGFSSTQIADSGGVVTNVAIQSGYSLLNMKCNKAEIRLRTLLAWMNELIIEDINRRNKTSYTIDDITEVIIERETMTDKKENVDIKLIEEQTRLATIDSILAVAPRLDDESVIKLICDLFELDWKEIQLLINEQDYTSGLQDEDDIEEVDIDEEGK